MLSPKKYLLMALLLPLTTSPMEQATSPGIVQCVVDSCTATKTRIALTIAVGLGLAGAMALWHKHRHHTAKTASTSRPDATHASITLPPIIPDVRLSNPFRIAAQESCSPESVSHCNPQTLSLYFPSLSQEESTFRYRNLPILEKIYAKYNEFKRKNFLMPIHSNCLTSALVLTFLGTYQPKNIDYVILENPLVTQEDIDNTPFKNDIPVRSQLNILTPTALTTIPKDIPFLILYNPEKNDHFPHLKQSATKLYETLTKAGITHCYLATHSGEIFNDVMERFVHNPPIDPTIAH